MVTILLQTLDGVWESPGIDREMLATPEGITTAGNAIGFDTCTWALKRQMAAWPDLSSYTPCEIWEDGTMIFEGRVQEAPMRKDPEDTLISVSGRGWQYHTDDDPSVEFSWVHTALTEWVDSRSIPECTLGAAGHFAAAQVSAGDGLIALTVPNGTAYPAGGRLGATLDFRKAGLGPKRVICDATTSNNDASLRWYFRASNSPNPTSTTDVEDCVSSVALAASQQLDGTITTPRRYLHVFLYRAAGVTYAADVWAKISKLACYKETALESGRASALTSSRVIKDALPYAPLLSQDTSGIEQTAFLWPDFHLSEGRTLREVADAANAAHRWQVKVGVGRRLLFRPQRTVPKYMVPSRVFEDASASSGEDVFNKALVVGTGPDGRPVRIERYSGALPGAPLSDAPNLSFANPSAAVDTSGWFSSGTLTRDTGLYRSSPASFYLTTKGSAQMTAGGTFRAGVPYLFRGYHLSDAYGGYVMFGVAANNAPGVEAWAPSSPAGWQANSVVWIPPRDMPSSDVLFTWRGDGFHLDDLAILTALPTLVDRRGFVRAKRLDVSAPLIIEVGTQFCDAFLQSHMRTPMRGSATIAPGDLYDFLTGQPLHPRVLVAEGGELIHFADIVDPDYGSVGRDGMIAAVGYDPETEAATVQLDNQRDNMEALLARYAVVAGGGGGG